MLGSKVKRPKTIRGKDLVSDVFALATTGKGCWNGGLAGSGDSPLAADCNDQNGCIGYSEGMRVFANDPTVRGVIEYNEKFIDLGTKTFNGIPCPDGVIRIGQNTNRAVDRGATQDTGKKVGVTGGRPVVGCAPSWGGR
jgi:hypothetical protein